MLTLKTRSLEVFENSGLCYIIFFPAQGISPSPSITKLGLENTGFTIKDQFPSWSILWHYYIFIPTFSIYVHVMNTGFIAIFIPVNNN